jgi:hypothetical protein
METITFSITEKDTGASIPAYELMRRYKVYCREVASVDLDQKGGFALQGTMLKSSFGSSNHLSTQATGKNPVVICVDKRDPKQEDPKVPVVGRWGMLLMKMEDTKIPFGVVEWAKQLVYDEIFVMPVFGGATFIPVSCYTSQTRQVLSDGSGSMNGNREYLAKALTLGICEAAHENGQDWHAFIFGSGNELTDTISQETPLTERLRWSTFLFGGGTDFDMALRHAIDEVEKSEDPTAVDIVMITDGDSHVMQATIDRLSQLKQTFGVRLIAILVDAGYGSLDKVADATIVINGTDQIERAATQLSDNLWK